MTMAELSPIELLNIAAGSIAVGGLLAGWVRWLWKRHRAAQELIVLESIDPLGYDPLLPQKESDLLLRYLQQIQDQNTFLSFPGVVRSLPLEKILVTPRLGVKPEVLLGQTALSPQDKSAVNEDPDLDRKLESGSILPWPQIRNLTDATFMVMGPAGAGKSTLLRHEAFLCAEALTRAGAKWGDPHNPIPVILRADQIYALALQGKNLRQAVQQRIAEVLETGGPPEDRSVEILDQCVDRAWNSRGIRLLLDALDELTSEDSRNSVLRKLQTHLTAGGCPFVLVSRPLRTGIPILHQTERNLYLAPFDLSLEIPLFIDNWFLDIPEKIEARDRLKELINGNSRLAGVCSTPLLLAFLCLAAEHGDIEEFSSRAELYRCLMRGLLVTWPNQLKPKRRFSEVKDLVLRHIAQLQLVQPQSLAGNELIKDLLQWSESTYRWHYGDVEALLTELTDVDCVLRIQPSSTSRNYYFFHSSVAEYYFALEATENNDAYLQLLAHLSEGRWHGAFAMFVAMSHDPLPLIRMAADCVTVDGLTQARLIDQCVSECGERLTTESLAECAWLAQTLCPLPWTALIAYDTVCTGIERLPDEDPGHDILTIANEIRGRALVPPKQMDSSARPLPNSVPKVLAALKSPYSITRWTAMWVLAVAGDTASAPQVAVLLSDPNPAIRGMAASLLGFLECMQFIGPLRELLHDPDWRVRRAAASALGHLGDKNALDGLLTLAQTDRVEVGRAATWALAQMAVANKFPTESFVRLKDFFVRQIEASPTPDPRILGQACSGIAGLSRSELGDLHAYLPRLESLLANEDSAVCHGAAYAIGSLADIGDIPLLESMASNPDARVRASAASGMGRLRQISCTALLVKLRTERDSIVQRAAGWALYNLPDQQLVEQELIHAINTVDEPTANGLLGSLVLRRQGAAKKAILLRSVAFQDRDAVKAAIQDRALELLGSPSPSSRTTGQFVLSRVPDKRAIEPCLELLKDPDSGVRVGACCVLQVVPDKRAVEPCLELLKDTDPGVRASACCVLQVVPDKRAIEPCLKLMKDPDPRVRASACGVLEVIPDKRAIGPCLELLKDPDPGVCASACCVLQVVPDKRAIELCLELLKNPDPRVRASACGLVVKVPLPLEVHAAVLQTLNKLAADPEMKVRDSALFAIRALAKVRRRGDKWLG